MSSNSNTNESCGCVGAAPARASGATFQPGVDIIETAHEYTVRVDVPGATAQHTDVQFEEGVLTVRASVPPRQAGGTKFLIREYGIGDYERSFRVHADIDADAIAAEIRHGVLTLRLPKSQEARPRKIAVAANA